MSRRLVIGQRSNGEMGLFVSKPGQDAYTAGEDQLLFSTFRHAMMVQRGSVALQGQGVGVRVNFDVTLAQKPLVFIGSENRPLDYPAYANADTTGFWAYPSSKADGTYPAANRTIAYFVFVKNVP